MSAVGMFEKSKIIWHRTKLEAEAETPTECREAIMHLAKWTGLIERAVRITRDTGEPELGAAFLVLGLTEMAVGTHAPPIPASALSALFQRAVVVIQLHYSTNPVVAMTLFTTAMGIQSERLAAALGEEDPECAVGRGSESGGPARSPLEFRLSGNMPDITQRQSSRRFRAVGHSILFLKDLPPVSSQLGANPMDLHYKYVLIAVEEVSQEPALFVLLEDSVAGHNFLGTLDTAGGHASYGRQENLAVESEFIRKGLAILREKLRLSMIEEIGR